ncbi:LysR family transcriptional regulator [Halomonas cupida]|uniref:LysR family transcriptional regulator n=1 Tax=Halomonas cupida TaxID=44933 RepID=A0A1M6ZJF3_9GAMM|nr:LysR family transcriptional regulator [Halomonas cupida]GEN24339.1 LysR family transcriptional regulator [Halomonas cupida]SHL30612.1 transcriptional regulator, LysR family [Halomonas cupida]
MDTPSRILMLVEVAELGSFSEVAKRREMDRSVVSKHIARLEQELGLRLINRSTRSLSLTEAGQAMVEQGRSLREWIHDTETMAESLGQGLSGRLKISAPGVLGRCIGFHAMRSFHAQYPDVEFDLQLEERRVDLIAEGYDLALRVGDLEDSNLIAQPLALNHLLIGASPDFIARVGEPRDLKQLASLPALTWSSRDLQVDFLRYRDANGVVQEQQLNTLVRTSEVEVIRNGVLAGMGIGVLPAFALGNDVRDGSIIPLMTDLPLEPFGVINMIYPHRQLPLRTRLFMDIMRETIGSPPMWEQRIPGFDSMYGKRREAPAAVQTRASGSVLEPVPSRSMKCTPCALDDLMARPAGQAQEEASSLVEELT